MAKGVANTFFRPTLFSHIHNLMERVTYWEVFNENVSVNLLEVFIQKVISDRIWQFQPQKHFSTTSMDSTKQFFLPRTFMTIP